MAPMPCATAILPAEGRTIRVRGLVQGVGFRPTVWRLARDCGLAGDVWNDAEGVMIRAWGRPADLDRFLRRLEEQPPPLASILGIAIAIPILYIFEIWGAIFLIGIYFLFLKFD